MQSPLRSMRTHAGIAWIAILVVVGGLMALSNLADSTQTAVAEPTAAGDAVLEVQVRMLLAQESLTPGKSEAEMILDPDTGSIGRGLRVIAAWSAVRDADFAREKLVQWRATLADRDLELTQTQAGVMNDLDRLFTGTANAGVLDEIEANLGWFGHLAVLASADDGRTKEQRLEPFMSEAITLMGVITIFALGIGGLGLVGFIALIVAVVHGVDGRLRVVLTPNSHDGVYAETFAVWLIFFTVLQVPAAMVGVAMAETLPQWTIAPSLCAFFLSLGALAWPRVRGVSWEQIRKDIGWTRGAGLVREIGCGLAGYAMALPIVAVGMGVTILLFMVLESGQDVSSAAHPIVGEVGKGGWIMRVLILLMASVAAPIVEETMFRGVLYRQVRSWLARRCTGGGSPLAWFVVVVLPSGLLTSVLFAAIHPQGLLVIPALASLAFAFALAREWRGSLIAPMVMHGVSNAIVMSLVFVLMS